jgi:hypothetical protein
MAGSQKTYKGVQNSSSSIAIIAEQIATDMAKMFKNADKEVDDTVKAVYKSAVDYAPKKSGTLSKSGSVTTPSYKPDDADAIVLNAHQISFAAPYAKAVEGVDTSSIPTGNFVQKVKSFKRRTKNGISTIKAHEKTYVNSRPVEIATNIWRTLPTDGPPPKGVFFLKQAFIKHVGEKGDVLVGKLLNKLKL